MAINKFKITELPVKASIEIDGIAAVLDQEYPISKQASMVVEVFGVGVPYDTFKYQLGNEDNIWSRTIEATINAEPDAGTPAATPYNLTVPSAVTTDVTVSITFDQYTDRIKFPDPGAFVNRYGYLFINGENVRYDEVYMIDDIQTIEYVSLNTGQTPNPTTQFSLQYGNVNGYSSTTNWNFTETGNMFAEIQTNSIVT